MRLADAAARLLRLWLCLASLPGTGAPTLAFAAAPQGARRASQEAWRPAGERDGSAFMRPMTDGELQAQAANC